MEAFRTMYGDRVRVHAPGGAPTEMRHTPHIDKNGRRTLKRDKEVAIYDLIQASREQCEIENIIRRAVEGDYNALNAVNGVYSDITNCPSSIAEAQQYIINAKNEFANLPKEIKAKFEYNPEVYIAEMGGDTETWLDKMGYKEAMKLKKEQEVADGINKENFNKAMANLASGTVITNQGNEGGEGNE